MIKHYGQVPIHLAMMKLRGKLLLKKIIPFWYKKRSYQILSYQPHSQSIMHTFLLSRQYFRMFRYRNIIFHFAWLYYVLILQRSIKQSDSENWREISVNCEGKINHITRQKYNTTNIRKSFTLTIYFARKQLLVNTYLIKLN